MSEAGHEPIVLCAYCQEEVAPFYYLGARVKYLSAKGQEICDDCFNQGDEYEYTKG